VQGAGSTDYHTRVDHLLYIGLYEKLIQEKLDLVWAFSLSEKRL